MRMLFAIAALLSSVAPGAAEDKVIWTTDGTCERLVIADVDITDRCTSALVHMLRDGRMTLSVGEGWNSDPIYAFTGAPSNGYAPWVSHSVDTISIFGSKLSPNVTNEAVSGRCTFSNVTAIDMDVYCQATDSKGRFYGARYRTDSIGPSLQELP